MASQQHTQVLVLGAGLSGLVTALDLRKRGIDVLVLEARDRPGGRVEHVVLEDGRRAQMGGEVVSDKHVAYCELVEELGLSLREGYAAEPGETTWDLNEGFTISDEPSWMTEKELDEYAKVTATLEKLVTEVDPANPWAHPDAVRLDSMSWGDWLRSQGASSAVIRAFEFEAIGLGGGSIERASMLSILRKNAAFGMGDDYTQTVVEGSAAVPLTMYERLKDQVRLNSVVTDIAVSAEEAQVILEDGSVFTADAVVCTIPARPLRAVNITGLSAERLASLRRMRHSATSKVVIAYEGHVWQKAGSNGMVMSERTIGVSWTQGHGILSITIPPERLTYHLAAPPEARKAEILDSLARMWGEDLREPVAYLDRDWGEDPFTLGYATWYAPGDLTAIGPLHGTHEPPFFVAGSDHWWAGFMEGAVRTGRSTAVEVAAYLSSPH